MATIPSFYDIGRYSSKSGTGAGASGASGASGTFASSTKNDDSSPNESVVSHLHKPCEIVLGIWIGTPAHLDDDEWFRSRNIHTVLNCAKHYEGTNGDNVYNLHDRTTEFIKKATRLLLNAHYGENKNCFIVCQTGLRISVIVLVHYLSGIAGISRSRSLDIIRTKLPLFYIDVAIQPYISG